MTPSERTLRARLAAYSLHSKVDSRRHTQAARDGFIRRFEDEVDPERILSEQERQKRAERALKAHMTRLALKSARARRKGAADAS